VWSLFGGELWSGAFEREIVALEVVRRFVKCIQRLGKFIARTGNSRRSTVILNELAGYLAQNSPDNILENML